MPPGEHCEEHRDRARGNKEPESFGMTGSRHHRHLPVPPEQPAEDQLLAHCSERSAVITLRGIVPQHPPAAIRSVRQPFHHVQVWSEGVAQEHHIAWPKGCSCTHDPPLAVANSRLH